MARKTQTQAAQKPATMRLHYMPMNEAWMLTWGGEPFALDGRTIFGSWNEAAAALEPRGLGLAPDGTVVVVEAS